MHSFPNVVQIDRLGPKTVRVFFEDGAVIDMSPLWLSKEMGVAIIDQGCAVRFGSGSRLEVSAWTLREYPGVLWSKAPGVGAYPGQTWIWGKIKQEKIPYPRAQAT